MVTLIFISSYKIVQNEKTQISTNPGTNASVGSGSPLVVKTSEATTPVGLRFWVTLAPIGMKKLYKGEQGVCSTVTYPLIRWGVDPD